VTRRAAIVFCAALAVAAIVFTVVSRRHQERAIAELRQEMSALGSAPATRPPEIRFVAVPAPAPPASKEAAPAAATTTAAAKPTEPASAPSPKEQMAATHQRYEAAFGAAPNDPDWRSRARQIVAEKLPGLLPEGSSMRSFDCRASICRLETAHKDHDSYMKFIQVAFLRSDSQLWNAATYSTPLNDDPGDGMMVTYIAREGQDLPN
jgi:hypothetical protein